MRIGGVLLAAGASTRFGGRPKGLLVFRTTTFLRHLATELAAVSSPTLVVSAPTTASSFSSGILGSGARLIVNRHPERGMGSSISTAVRTLDEIAPELDALLVALVDQPLADRTLFGRLIAAAVADPARSWAASDYGNGVIGPPALFPRSAFGELAALSGDFGARPLIERERPRLALVPFPGGRFDVDVGADYERLLEVE